MKEDDGEEVDIMNDDGEPSVQEGDDAPTQEGSRMNALSFILQRVRTSRVAFDFHPSCWDVEEVDL